ncbi:MAG: hypothetical protein ACR2PQ_13050 [Myxococcota bacterium]
MDCLRTCAWAWVLGTALAWPSAALAAADADAESGEPRGAVVSFEASSGCHNLDLLLPPAEGAPAPRVLPVSRLCPFEPRTDCHHPMKPGRSKLTLLDHPRKATRDKLKWKFKKGDETSPSELGDPTTDTDYELCVYVSYGDICFLVLHPDAPAGPGWSRRRNGYAYKPGKNHPDGLRKLRVRSGPDQRARAQVKSKGSIVDFPLLPIPPDAPVLTQLYNSNGTCWSNEFGFEPRENSGKRFKDQSEN